MAVDNNKAKFAAEAAVLADELNTVLAKTRDLYNRYWDTGISNEVNALASGEMVPDTGFDRELLLSFVTLCENFVAFCDGSAVAQNTYRIPINRVAALRS